MIFARENIQLGSSYVNTLERDTFIPSDRVILKLSVIVTLSDVIIWPVESDPPAWQNQMDEEILLKQGFYSLIPVTPWTGFRLKSATATDAIINFVAYA